MSAPAAVRSATGALVLVGLTAILRSPVTPVSTTNSSVRRRLRRKRAVARFQWWLHRSGRAPLSISALKRIHSVLKAHHSKDPSLLRAISSRIGKMSEQVGPWKCVQCRKMAKASSEFCAHCGQHWSKVWDKNAVPSREATWSYSRQDRSPRTTRQDRSQWPELPPRSPSRRTRRHGGKGQSLKGEGKGKSKKDNQSGAVFPTFPSCKPRQLGPPIALVAPPVPQPIPAQSAENAQMKALMAALKKASSDLPPEIQAAMRGLQQDDSKQLTKQLHRSSDMPRKILGTCSNHGAPSWKSPLPDGKGMQRSLPSRTKIWRLRSRRPKACKENFRAFQKLEGVTKEETEVISDEEEQPNLSKVDVHMSQMQASLAALKGNMEEELRVAWTWRWCYCLSLWAGRQVSDAFISCRPFAVQWSNAFRDLPCRVCLYEDAADLSRALGLAPTVPSIPAIESLPRDPTTMQVRFSDAVDLRLSTDLVATDYVVPRDLLRSWPHNIQHEAPGVPSPMEFWSGDVCERFALISSPLANRRIVFHGLSETRVGTRSSLTLLNPNPEAFVEQLREVWPEFKDCVMRVHLVRLQPQDATPSHHFITEFLLNGDLPHHSIEPVLQETVIWDADGQPDLQRVALYHQRRLHRIDIAKPFSDICRRARFVCNVRVLGRVLPL